MVRFRAPNPTPTQWAIIGGTTAFVVGLGATAVAASRRRPKLPSVGPQEPEGPIDPPAGPPPVGPEVPTGPVVEPEQPPGALVDWEIVSGADAAYPWEFPALHYDNYPTPGTWINVADRTGDFDPQKGFDALVIALLGSALAMAGNDYRIASAMGSDPNASLGRALRRSVREGIMIIGGVNDMLYGQTNLNYAGGNDPNAPGGDPNRPYSASYVLNTEGRGLNWLPRHANNLDRIQLQQPLRRATSLAGEPLPPPDRGNRQMLVWLPAFDLVPLGPNQAMPQIRYMKWSDGSSTIDPPPQIRDLGVDMSGVSLPGVNA